MATFITSKAVGETMNISVQTSTGYWKYNHDGTDSTVFNQNDGGQTITVANANGEFTIISCLSDGTVSGDITQLELVGNQLTSFDGTGFSGLNILYLSDNQLTSFDGTGLTSLTSLNLGGNPLTTFIGGDMGLITILDFINWNITTLTSFDGTGLSSLTQLWLGGNQLTSFDGTGLSSLTALGLSDNQLTSFNGTGLSSLSDLSLEGNLLTSLDVSPLVNLYFLRLYLMGMKGNPTLTNPITPSSNNQILFDLAQHSINGGEFFSTNGRTSASNSDYDNLVNNLGWTLSGLDLNETTTTTTTSAPVAGNGKLRIKGVNTGGGVAPTTTTTTTIPTPSSQADYFQILSVVDNGTTLDVTASFRLANPLVSGYLVTMDDLSDATMGNGANSLANSTLNGNPADGDAYSVGQTIATNTFNNQPNGIIVKMGPAVNTSTDSKGDTIETFTLNNVPRNTNGHTYEFNVFAYNLGSMNDGKEANFYNRNNPLRTALNVVVTGGGGKSKTQTKGE